MAKVGNCLGPRGGELTWSLTVTGQIEYWAMIGKCAEENPDLTYSLIKEILIGLTELEQGEFSEYQFG